MDRCKLNSHKAEWEAVNVGCDGPHLVNAHVSPWLYSSRARKCVLVSHNRFPFSCFGGGRNCTLECGMGEFSRI